MNLLSAMLIPDESDGELEPPDLALVDGSFEIIRMWVIPQVDDCPGCGGTHESVLSGAYAADTDPMVWAATLATALRQIAGHIAAATGQPLEVIAGQIEFGLHECLTAHSMLGGMGRA